MNGPTNDALPTLDGAGPTEIIPVVLFTAILKANAERLQDTMLGLITLTPENAQEVAAKLLTSKSLVHPRTYYPLDHDGSDEEDSGPESDESDSRDDPDTGEPDEHRSKRRKHDNEQQSLVPQYEICRICAKEFDVTQNDRGSCKTHPRKLDVNYEMDSFPYQPDFSGPFDSLDDDERIREFPDAFIWPCCEKDAFGEPCCIQRHKTKDSKLPPLYGLGRSGSIEDIRQDLAKPADYEDKLARLPASLRKTYEDKIAKGIQPIRTRYDSRDAVSDLYWYGPIGPSMS